MPPKFLEQVARFKGLPPKERDNKALHTILIRRQ